MNSLTASTQVKEWEAPFIEEPSEVESTLLARIQELTQILSEVDASEKESILEREHLVNHSQTLCKLTKKIYECARPAIGNACSLVSELERTEQVTKVQKDMEDALIKLQQIEKNQVQLEKIMNVNAEPVQPKTVIDVDTHYQDSEAQKTALLKLYEKDLKPTSVYPIKSITSKLDKWDEFYRGIQKNVENSKNVLATHVRELRKFIDYLEANPIPATYNSSIAQYLAMLDDDMVDKIQFEVTNIEEVVKANCKEVEQQIGRNGNIIKELKARHDKFLKQYVQVESLLQKIDLRLKKFTHHMVAHPEMLILKDVSTKFQGRLTELNDLLKTNQSSLFSLVLQVLGFITEYNGKNPLKEEKFQDPKFKEKMKKIEDGWTVANFKFQENSEYCGYVNGTVQLPEKGLFVRAQEMKVIVEEAEKKLEKLLIDYETKKMIETIFGSMKFYDSMEQDKLIKCEESHFITELSEINDLLVAFRAGWKQTATLFAKTIPDTLNVVCSSVMTNDGKERSGIGYLAKGVVQGNTKYVLPPF